MPTAQDAIESDKLHLGLVRRSFMECWRCRELQYGRLLAPAKPRQQHHAPVWKFQRIMVCVGIIEVDPAETSEIRL